MRTLILLAVAVAASAQTKFAAPPNLPPVLGIEVDVRSYGAVADNGTTDNTVKFQAACDALYAVGGGVLFIPAGRWGLNTSSVNCFGPISWRGVPNKSIIVGRNSANNSSREITISSCLSTAYTPSCSDAGSVIDRTATGTLAIGQVSLTLSNVTGLAVGDTVYMWLGDDPTDVITHGLPAIQMFNTVASIVGSVVTFNDPIAEAVPDPASQMRFHHVWKPAQITENISVTGLRFERDVVSGNLGYRAFSINFARNVHLDNIFAQDIGFASLGLHNGSNYALTSITCVHMVYDAVRSTGTGNCIDGWTMNNLSIKNIYAADVNGQAIGFEGQNRGISIDGGWFSEGQSDTAFPVFIDLADNSLGVAIRNSTFISSTTSGVFNAVSVTPDTPLLENLSLWNAVHIKMATMQGFLSYNGVLGVSPLTWSARFQVLPNMTNVNLPNMPQGWYKVVRAYVSSTTGITKFSILSTTGQDYSSFLVAGQTVDLTSSHGSLPFVGPPSNDPNNNPANGPPYGKFMQISTDGTVPANTVATIEIDYFPLPTTDTSFQGRIQDMSNYVDSSVARFGTLSLTSLPTSCSGLTTGTVWNNSGALGVCP